LNYQTVNQCREILDKANSVVALTGAGISTNAGIPDFRGPQGLYITQQYDPEKIFDIHYFNRDPKPFFDFARDFIELEKTVQPTIAHRFLSALEKTGKLSGVVTQNIDSLHQMAGSKNVVEIHGSFWISHCLQCWEEYSYDELKHRLPHEDILKCACQGIIKPDIVFFGENVKNLDKASDLVAESDVLFVIGTSCVVYPAAMLPSVARGKIIIINMTPVELNAANIELSVQGDIDSFFSILSKQMYNAI